MKISQTNGCYLGKFSDEQVIDLMAEAGFDAIDFGFLKEEYYNEATDTEEGEAHFLHLKKYAKDRGVYFNQAHAPFPTSSKDEEENEKIFRDVVRSMKNASLLGIRNIVVHPNQHLIYEEEGVPEELYRMNVEFYNRLKPYCKKYNIKVCVENMWQYHGLTWRKGIIVDSTCSAPEEFVRYMDALDPEYFGACLDIGHCMLVHQDPAQFIKKLGERLVALHVHDVDGDDDLHTIPYFGGMGDWDKIAKALSDINYKGDFTMEVISFLTDLPDIKMYKTASKMIAEVGRYIANKIK